MGVSVIVQALPVGLAETEIPDKAIFVFDTVAKGGVGPGALSVVSLIFEANAVDVVDFVGGEVELAEDGTYAIRISVGIQFFVAIAVVEGTRVVLPS